MIGVTENAGDGAARRLTEVEDELRRLSIARTARDPEALARRDLLDVEQAELRARLGLPPASPIGDEEKATGGPTGWMLLCGACVLVVTLLVIFNTR